MIYKTEGTCAKEIRLQADHGIIRSVEFVQGCPGFTQALSRLLAGMEIREAIQRLRGIQCMDKGTSCPDQLVRALELLEKQDTPRQES